MEDSWQTAIRRFFARLSAQAIRRVWFYRDALVACRAIALAITAMALHM
ncbi:hypothetical protein [Pseudomonas nicosulfuronedens]